MNRSVVGAMSVVCAAVLASPVTTTEQRLFGKSLFTRADIPTALATIDAGEKAMNLRSCRLKARPETTLASAIVAVENQFGSAPENAVKQGVLYLATAFSLAPPELSYGPAHIKPAFVRIYFPEAQSHLRTLYDPCEALVIVSSYIRQTAPHLAEARASDQQAAICTALRKYNGRRTDRNFVAEYSFQIYAALVLAKYFSDQNQSADFSKFNGCPLAAN